MRQLDIVTAYLYGTLDTEIYMRVPPELMARYRTLANIRGKSTDLPTTSDTQRDLITPSVTQRRNIKKLGPLTSSSKSPSLTSAQSKSDDPSGSPLPTPRHGLATRVLKALYGLKQSGRVWFQRFADEMTSMGFIHNQIAPCLFIKHHEREFIIVAIYVDDINIFGTPDITEKTITSLKSSFEMKDLGDTHFCLGLQLEILPTGILLHQTTYAEKILKQFNMNMAHPLSTPMVVRSLERDKDVFSMRKDNEPILGSEIPYLSAIGALMYLANQTRPDIAFAVNLLARHSASPTIRHWNGIKHILRYIRGHTDVGLFFPFNDPHTLVGFADAGYLSDPDTAKSQTGYVFKIGSTAFSWKSVKQTITATSSNHAEILALHEASREALWLRQLLNHIHTNCGLPSLSCLTDIYEDNAACVHQIHQGFIKGDRIKHIAPKFFFTHELHGVDINVKQISSAANSADLFTKSLPPATHHRHCHDIGLRRLSHLQRQT
jgi:hypothetical protein